MRYKPHPPPNLPLEGGGDAAVLNLRFAVELCVLPDFSFNNLPFKGRDREGMGLF